jgi:hypothetical protein
MIGVGTDNNFKQRMLLLELSKCLKHRYSLFIVLLARI